MSSTTVNNRAHLISAFVTTFFLMCCSWGLAQAPQAISPPVVTSPKPQLTITTGEAPTSSAVRAVAFSSDDAVIATGDSQGRIKMKTLASGGETETSRGETQGGVTLWDIKTGKHRLLVRDAGPLKVVALSYSADGQILVSGMAAVRITFSSAKADSLYCGNAGYGEVEIWNLNTGHLQRVIKMQDEMASMSYAPSRGVVAVGTWGHGFMWNVQTGHLLHILPGDAADLVALSPNGELVIGGWNVNVVGMNLCNAHTGRRLRKLQVPGTYIWTVTFAPNGKVIATGSGSENKPGAVCLWDAATGHMRRMLRGHMVGVHTIAFSHDGTLLASGSEDGIVNVWPMKQIISN